MGVTDGSEGTGTDDSHTVDNIGRNNYVLFEFSQTVVVDSAFLGYVVTDSDLKVWIGSTMDRRAVLKWFAKPSRLSVRQASAGTPAKDSKPLLVHPPFLLFVRNT